MFELCCSPISGGNFVSQIAILTTLLEIRNKSSKIEKIHFDLYLGASGGSLANIITTFFEGSKESIERIVYILNSKMFVQNWWKGKFSFIDSKLVSMFQDSMYQSGKGAVETFKSLTVDDHFSKEDISENWFLTFNNDKNIPVIHSTTSSENSLFNKKEDFDFCEVKYLDYKLEKIIETVMASASIPGLKESVIIDNENHVDGGVANPSPYYYFSELLYLKHLNKSIEHPYHFYYILPRDLKLSKNRKNIWVTDVLDGIQKMISFSIFKDQEFVFESWLRMISKSKRDLVKIRVEKGNKKEILKILEENHQYDYFITLFTDENTIDITNFEKKDLEHCFQNCYQSIFLEIFINKN